jgi:hypothetical protein
MDKSLEMKHTLMLPISEEIINKFFL